MARRRFTVAHRRGERMNGVNVLSTTSFRPCSSQYGKGVSRDAQGAGASIATPLRAAQQEVHGSEQQVLPRTLVRAMAARLGMSATTRVGLLRVSV